MEKKVFRSRISVLLVIILLAVLLPVAISIIRLGNIFNPGFYIFLGVIVFIVFTLTGMRYVISGNKLHLEMWFISSGSVNIANIVSIKRTYNPLTSPAASLKRLAIHCTTGWMGGLISPVREKEFFEALKVVNPDIYIRVNDKKGWWRIWDWDI